MGDAKQKLVYILPFYDEGTDTHLFYNYKLIGEVKKLADIKVLIVGSGFSVWRFLKLLLKSLSFRVRGYKNFYVHYSFYGAIAAFLVCGKVFYWNRGMPWLYKRGWFEEKIFKFILRNTILVTGPESLAKEYQERYGVKEYRVLSNWVDTERFLPSRKPMAQASQDLAKLAPESLDKRVVLFVHHLSKRKGSDLVPEIAKGFGNDVLFLMIGDGPEREALKSQITNSKLQTNIKILGKISNSEIPKYTQSADVFLMPSREEGSPHVLLEAMASGVPFVASDVGGVRELIPQDLEQFLCRPEDIKCFQNKIKTLLSDKALYDKASTACLSHSKNFDISRGVTEFISLFK